MNFAARLSSGASLIPDITDMLEGRFTITSKAGRETEAVLKKTTLEQLKVWRFPELLYDVGFFCGSPASPLLAWNRGFIQHFIDALIRRVNLPLSAMLSIVWLRKLPDAITMQSSPPWLKFIICCFRAFFRLTVKFFKRSSVKNTKIRLFMPILSAFKHSSKECYFVFLESLLTILSSQLGLVLSNKNFVSVISSF